MRGVNRSESAPIEPPFARALGAETAGARRFDSRHRYALEALGLSREQIVNDFSDVFDRFGFPTVTQSAG